MKYENDGFDPTPYDRILGGIHVPARENESEILNEDKRSISINTDASGAVDTIKSEQTEANAKYGQYTEKVAVQEAEATTSIEMPNALETAGEEKRAETEKAAETEEDSASAETANIAGSIEASAKELAAGMAEQPNAETREAMAEKAEIQEAKGREITEQKAEIHEAAVNRVASEATAKTNSDEEMPYVRETGYLDSAYEASYGEKTFEDNSERSEIKSDVITEQPQLPDTPVIYNMLEFTETRNEKPIRIQVEEDILVPDIKPDMASILSMSGDIRVNEREIKTGIRSEDNINVSGDISLKTIYIPEKEMTEPVISILSRVPFKAEWKTEIPALAKVNIYPEIEKIEYQVINERKFRVRATATLSMKEYIKNSLSFFEGIEGEEVELLREKVTFTDVSAKKSDTIDIKEAISLKEGMPEPEQILKYDIRTVENHKQVTQEKAVINGSVYYSILYLAKSEIAENESAEALGLKSDGAKGNDLNEREKALPFMYQGKVDFTQFITLAGVSGQSGSRVRFDDSDLVIKLKSGMQEETQETSFDREYERDDFYESESAGMQEGYHDPENRNAAFVLEGNVRTDIEVYRNIESEIAADAYHNEKELVYESEAVSCGALEGSGIVEIPVREIINIPPESGEIERVIYITGRVLESEANAEYGKEVISGVLEAEIIAEPADKRVPPFKMTKKIPFRGSMDIACARNGMAAEDDMYIRDLRCDKINNKQVEINAGLFVTGTVYSRSQKRLIKNPAFIEQESNDERRPGMILYVTKPQDTLWSIAKKFRTTITKIRRVNDIAEEKGISEGRRLLIIK